MQEELESLKAMAGKNELGNLTRVAENAREVWRWNWLESLWQDIRYSVRTLRKSPGFTITAVVVLSIGIGLNLAFFQFINAIFLKPLAVRDPGSLVHVTVPPRRDQLNYPAMQFLRSSNTVFSAVLLQIWHTNADKIEWDGRTAPRQPTFVSANWFEELGVKPLRGRLFSEATEGKRDSPAVAVISEWFWETQLLKDPAILGSTVLTEGGVRMTIIGIVPRGPGSFLPMAGSPFNALNQPDIWVPAEQLPLFFQGGRFGAGEAVTGSLFARLKPGISLTAATQSLVPLLDELARQQPSYRRNNTVALFSGSTNFIPHRTVEMLFAGSVLGSVPLLILLISCSNLANLVLSRAISRIQELSVRVSLGASRGRILRHLLTETVLVASLASCGGLFLTYWAVRILPDIVTGFPLKLANLSLDWRTLVAAIAGTIVMTAFVGLLPAWTIGKKDLAMAMKDGGEQTSHSLSRVRQRQFLLAVQVGGSCLLLIVTSFILRTLQHALTPPGYNTENVLILGHPMGRELENAAANTYWRSLREHMAQQPGVESVALSENWPSDRNARFGRVAMLPGVRFEGAMVEPDFFRLLRIPFLTGKPFLTSDSQGQSVVLSKGLAIQAFGTVDVVGKVFPELGRVTGVVDDLRLSWGERGDLAEAYLPLKVPVGLLLRARTSADATRLLYTLPKSLRQFDSRVPSIDRLERKLNDGVAETRLAGTVSLVLATLALSVACMGIFGVVSYGVALRRKEIGIRLALGALDRSILWLMARQLIWPVGLATVVGTIGGLAFGILTASEELLLAPEVPVVAAALLILLAMIGLACALPTLRMLRRADTRVLSS